MSWEGIDPPRDEDGPRFTERDFERYEIGSDAYVMAPPTEARAYCGAHTHVSQVCGCHGEPMYWHKRDKYPAGGFWVCGVKAREKVHAWRLVNREKRREQSRRWKTKNLDQHRESRRNSTLKRKYGITTEEYDAILLAQDGACAVCKGACKSGNNLAVDHDHKTGRVRGLLCGNCNTAIGKLGDSPELLLVAVSYLRGSNA